MKYRSSTSLVAGLLAAGLAVPAHAETTVGTNIGVASNHIFRGTASDIAVVSGGIDLNHDGLFLGLWTVTTKFADLTGERNYGYELDVYTGYAGKAGEFGYSVGVTNTTYPMDDELSYDYTELNLKASYGFANLEVDYNFYDDAGVDVNGDGDDETEKGSLYYAAGVTFDLVQDFKFKLTVGHYDYGGDSLLRDYSHARIDLVKSTGDFGDVTFSVSKREEDVYFGIDDDVRVLVAWSKAFY